MKKSPKYPLIKFDKKSHCYYAKFNSAKIYQTITIAPFVFVDLDKNGNVVGVEVVAHGYKVII